MSPSKRWFMSLIILCHAAMGVMAADQTPPLPEGASIRLGKFVDYKRGFRFETAWPGYFALTFSPDSNWLVTGLLQVWDVETKKLIATLSSDFLRDREIEKRGCLASEPVIWISYSTSGKLCYFLRTSGDLQAWSTKPTDPVSTFKNTPWAKDLGDCLPNSTGGNIWLFRQSLPKSTVEYYFVDIEQPKKLHQLTFQPLDDRSYPSAFEWESNRTRFLLGTTSGKVHLCDRVSGKCVGELQAKEGDSTKRIYTVRKTPNQRYVVSNYPWVMILPPPSPRMAPKPIRLNELASGQLICEFSGLSPTDISPDGRLLVFGGTEPMNLNDDNGDARTFRIVDLDTFQELGKYQHEKGFVAGLTFSPNGKWLATCGNAGTALLWKTEQWYSAPAKVADLSKDELESAWGDLTKEAKIAYPLIRKLSARPKQVLPFLKEQLQADVPDAELIKKWVRELDADEFRTRDRASKALFNVGADAVPELKKALQGKPSADAQLRIEKLLAEFSYPGNAFVTSTRTLRHLRTLEILERIGTDEAKALIEPFSRLDPSTHEARDAKATLERLNQKR